MKLCNSLVVSPALNPADIKSDEAKEVWTKAMTKDRSHVKCDFNLPLDLL